MENNVQACTEMLDTTIKHGFQSLLLAAGFKLKLFDHVGEERNRRTSLEVADSAGLKERYVREWLNAMVIARFIECDTSGQKYWMTNAVKESLITTHGQIIIATTRIWTHMIKVFDEICDCFRLDGPRGTPWSLYGDIHEAVGNLTGMWQDPQMIQHTIPSIPGLQEKLGARCSFESRYTQIIYLEMGINCLDIGCGVGIIPMLLSHHFPRSQFYGVDLMPDVIEKNSKRAQEKGLSNVRFIMGDADHFPTDWTNRFDFATSNDAVHDFAHADVALKEIVRVLKPGGQFSMSELDVSSNVYENIRDPKAAIFSVVSLFACTPLSMYFPGGLGLGLMAGKQKLTTLLKEAGFGKIELISQPWDKYGLNAHFLCTKTQETD